MIGSEDLIEHSLTQEKLRQNPSQVIEHEQMKMTRIQYYLCLLHFFESSPLHSEEKNDEIVTISVMDSFNSGNYRRRGRERAQFIKNKTTIWA